MGQPLWNHGFQESFPNIPWDWHPPTPHAQLKFLESVIGLPSKSMISFFGSHPPISVRYAELESWRNPNLRICAQKIPVKTSSFKISTLISPFQLFNQPTCRNSVCFTIFCSLKSLCSPTKDCWPRCFPFFGGGQAMRTCEISTIKTVTKKQQAFRLFYLQGPSDVFFRKDFLQCPRSKKTNDPSHPAQCQKSWQGQLELWVAWRVAETSPLLRVFCNFSRVCVRINAFVGCLPGIGSLMCVFSSENLRYQISPLITPPTHHNPRTSEGKPWRSVTWSSVWKGGVLLFIKGILATPPPKATPPRNMALLRVY